MQKITKVIVPIDFTKHTAKIVEYAIYVGRSFSATVSFVHVAESYGGHYAGFAHPSFEKVEADIRSQAEKKMEDLVEDSCAEGVTCTGKVLTGDVVDGIIKYALDEKADLLVIGTHGTKGFEKILLGSVAERLVQKAHCPVLTFNPFK